MSDITFDGRTRMITFTDGRGSVVGSWPANNRTDSHSSLRFVPNGDYNFRDKTAPTYHDEGDTSTGSYGAHGALVLEKFQEHEGIAIHSGRQGIRDKTPKHGAGAYHPTKGCIRTTEDAMKTITSLITTDPLVKLKVRNNHLQE